MANASTHPTFSLDMHHIYQIHDARYRFIYLTGDQASFSNIDDPLKVITYETGTLNRLSATGKIEVMPYGLMPADMRPVANDFEDIVLAGLRISRKLGGDFTRSRARVSRHRGQPFHDRGQAG